MKNDDTPRTDFAAKRVLLRYDQAEGITARQNATIAVQEMAEMTKELEKELNDYKYSAETLDNLYVAAQRELEIVRAQLVEIQKDNERLLNCLDEIRLDSQTTIDLYNKNGPTWTSRDSGMEYYDASYVIDSAQERIDKINNVRRPKTFVPLGF